MKQEISYNAFKVIFLVEDSLPIRILLSSILNRNGYFVLSFPDGKEALEALEHIRPELIISDVEMPNMDGFELAREYAIRRKGYRVPVLFITSAYNITNRAKAKKLGALSVLKKPLDVPMLLSVVGKVVSIPKVA